MAQLDRPVVPGHLLDALEADQRAAVLSRDVATAAGAMLDVIEALPAFSSQVQVRSQWLGLVRGLLALMGDATSDQIEIRMLAAIARTAFAARETTAGLAAAEHALNRAIEAGDLAAQVSIRASRLPFLAIPSPVEAARDARMLDAAVAQLGKQTEPGLREAEVALAHVAWYGAAGELERMRGELAGLGRLSLPRTEGLAFIAYASQSALAQLFLRSHQRAQAAQALIEAARLADGEDAQAELANLQVVISAIAMQAGDFGAAVAHAHSAVQAAAACPCQHAQPDPWLGFPIDISLTRTCGGAVQSLAEAVLHAQDIGDAQGFLIAASAMAAFYLADDRALEALDALTEAAEVARSLDDGDVAQTLRAEAEGLLGQLGILKR